jgi:hypothetical protein
MSTRVDVSATQHRIQVLTVRLDRRAGRNHPNAPGSPFSGFVVDAEGGSGSTDTSFGLDITRQREMLDGGDGGGGS